MKNETGRRSTVTFAIFKVSKFSNFRNRLLEIDFPFKNSIICTAISHIFISYLLPGSRPGGRVFFQHSFA